MPPLGAVVDEAGAFHQLTQKRAIRRGLSTESGRSREARSTAFLGTRVDARSQVELSGSVDERHVDSAAGAMRRDNVRWRDVATGEISQLPRIPARMLGA